MKTTVELSDKEIREIILKHLNLPHGDVTFSARQCKDDRDRWTGDWYVEAKVESGGLRDD